MEDYAFPNITFETLAPALKDEQEQKAENP
jgi:hypothetical protein